MSILDEFKVYCRDKGKYNVTDFNEIVKLFADFEEERKSRKDYDPSADSPSISDSDLANEDSDGYLSTLFGSLKK